MAVQKPLAAILVTLAGLIGSGLPQGFQGRTVLIPTYVGIEDPEIAGAASLRNIETLEAALNSSWRDQPVGLLVATFEGWGWATPGLACKGDSKSVFVRAILDGDAQVVNRALMADINQHNRRLEGRGVLESAMGCEAMETVFQ